MKPSILKKLFLSFLAFGLLMGLIFPVYAGFFVEWKEGAKLWFTLGSIIAGLSIGFINYWLFKVILLNRLKQISVIAQAISNNDISHECSLQSNDLIGEIINSFNHMVANLRGIIGHITDSASELETQTQQLITISNQGMEGVEQQKDKTDQVVQVMAEFSNGVQQITDGANETVDLTTQANKQATESALIATEAIGSICALSGDIDNAAKVINQLDQKSESIGNMLDVIRGIAEQTNLLALNAAIEAARAGEQGRGFAVVADEVRTLATRTQQSTGEIEEIISHLQQGSRDAVKAMDGARSQANTTEEHFEQAAELLAEIAGAVHAISEKNHSFAQTASMQNEMVGEVCRHVQTINDVSHQISEGSVQAVDASSGLHTRATELRGLVEQFKS
jgi:methyl-accepting chemotaxis protein